MLVAFVPLFFCCFASFSLPFSPYLFLLVSLSRLTPSPFCFFYWESERRKKKKETKKTTKQKKTKKKKKKKKKKNKKKKKKKTIMSFLDNDYLTSDTSDGEYFSSVQSYGDIPESPSKVTNSLLLSSLFLFLLFLLFLSFYSLLFLMENTFLRFNPMEIFLSPPLR